MRILCFADLHHESFDFFNCLGSLSEKDYDTVLSLGDNDYYDFEKIRRYVGADIYGVLGNHDSFRTLEESNVINLHRSLKKINSVTFAGYDGASKYKGGEFPSHTQGESVSELIDMDRVDILISHEGPFALYSSMSSHCGFKGITEYINRNDLYMNIHGHHHKNSKTAIGGTTIIGVYGIAIIDTCALDIRLLNSR